MDIARLRLGEATFFQCHSPRNLTIPPKAPSHDKGLAEPLLRKVKILLGQFDAEEPAIQLSCGQER